MRNLGNLKRQADVNPFKFLEGGIDVVVQYRQMNEKRGIAAELTKFTVGAGSCIGKTVAQFGQISPDNEDSGALTFKQRN